MSLKLLLDENVPTSVCLEFEKAGHSPIKLQRAVPLGSTDDLVAAAAIENRAVLVSHDSDFKALARSQGISNRRFKKLNLIHITAKSPNSAARIRFAMQFIQDEFLLADSSQNYRVHLEVGNAYLKTNR